MDQHNLKINGECMYCSKTNYSALPNKVSKRSIRYGYDHIDVYMIFYIKMYMKFNKKEILGSDSSCRVK